MIGVPMVNEQAGGPSLLVQFHASQPSQLSTRKKGAARISPEPNTQHLPSMLTKRIDPNNKALDGVACVFRTTHVHVAIRTDILSGEHLDRIVGHRV